MEPRERIMAFVEKYGLTVTWEFVPWSESRSAGEKYPSLNWKMSVARNGRVFYNGQFTMGCAHCPSYVQRLNMGVDDWDKIRRECETGRRLVGRVLSGKSIKPDLATYFANLASDCDAIDSPTYEEYASDRDMNPDSREGERVYQECLRIALTFRNALGEEGFRELREACRDF